MRRTPTVGATNTVATISPLNRTGAMANRRRANMGGGPPKAPAGGAAFAGQALAPHPARRAPPGLGKPRDARRDLLAGWPNHGTIPKGHEGRPMELGEAPRRVLPEIERRVLRQRRFELVGHQPREVLPDALGLSPSVCTAIQTNDAACATSSTASRTMKPSAMRQ